NSPASPTHPLAPKISLSPTSPVRTYSSQHPGACSWPPTITQPSLSSISQTRRTKLQREVWKTQDCEPR
ncbi:hypothetical protein M427DRAFT_50995, partial [Gonapodya prolifera JEL478]